MAELEGDLERERAQRASEVARRDALLAQCRDAILALEAQLARCSPPTPFPEARQRVAPPPAADGRGARADGSWPE